jgi:bacillopeptidase F
MQDIGDESPRVQYNAWSGVTSESASGGSYRTSAKAGSVYRFTFTGSAVDWITAAGPSAGKAKVLIDGANKGIVDLYAPSQTWQVAKTYAGLGAGSHKIQVRVLGKKAAASSGVDIVVDAFAAR